MSRLAAIVQVAILGATANKSGDSLFTTIHPSATNDSGLLRESASGNISDTRYSKRGFDGCPEKISILQDGNVLAGITWMGKGNDVPQLACMWTAAAWFAETKYTMTDDEYIRAGSMIINPGCTLYVFVENNYGGKAGIFDAGHYPNTPIGNGFHNCYGIACFKSVIWTCKQTYPTCTPSDSWEPITELDNSGSSVSTEFTYEKAVGTTFSSSMTESMSVSAEVSASISTIFWGITATLGVSLKTGYDWSTTDSETKSEKHTYTVSVKVPPKTKVTILNVVGKCGGSKIYTQMFKVKDNADSHTGEKILAIHRGKIPSYVLPGKHVQDHASYDNAECLYGNGGDYTGTTSQTISGRTCQKWSSQSPNKHGFGALGNNNYCRNPNNRDGVWCYTEDRRRKWEYCYVPICG